MTTIRFAGKTDQKQWDAYVRAHPDSWPYHLFAWRNAVEEAYGQKAYYIIAENDGDFVGVLPLIYLRFPTLVSELTALAYCDVGNCLADDETVGDRLLAAAVDLGRTLGVEKLHLRGQMQKSKYSSSLISRDSCDKVRMFLSLPDSSETLMASFKSKLRSQIRKASKNGVVFQWGEGDGAVDEFYAVFSENMRELGSPVHSREWFAAVLRAYGENSRLGLVKFDGRTIGCAIVLIMGNRISVPWASTLRRYNRLAAGMLLYWNLLRFSCDHGHRDFDFGRSTLNSGTYRFKYQWGARPGSLEWHSVFLKGGKTVEADHSRSLRRRVFERVWPRLPLAVTTFLGPRLRKHISY